MLHIRNIEEIYGLLLNAAELVQLYEERNAAFLNSTMSWLQKIELTLLKNRLPIVAEIAGKRGLLISSSRGYTKNDESTLKRLSKRKAAEQIAVNMINSVVEIITKAITPDIARISNAEARMFELVIIARQIGLLKQEYKPPFDGKLLNQIWEGLINAGGSADNKTISERAIAVQTLLGKSDSLLMLDKVLCFMN